MDYNPKSQVPFSDPVVRCDSCRALILRSSIHTLGLCPKCGNRRIRNVLVLSTEEMFQLKQWGIDPKFIALFEEVEELTPRSSDPDYQIPEEVGCDGS